MTDIQLAHLAFGGAPRDRNREHLVAIREADIATLHRVENEAIAPFAARAGRVGLTGFRVLAGGPAVTTNACACPA